MAGRGLERPMTGDPDLARLTSLVPAREWTDEDGEPLGDWAEITDAEWSAIVTNAGGLQALTVFSTLTDPDGTYGRPTIYTAWGRPDDPVPLVDIRDDKLDKDAALERTLRRFIPREESCS